MVFTRKFDICHLQVFVMNPNLNPLAVNVVIGDNLYKLKFHVERDPIGSCQPPMEMDNYQEEGGADPKNDSGENRRGDRQQMGHIVNLEG
jgi:hypothetical protein